MPGTQTTNRWKTTGLALVIFVVCTIGGHASGSDSRSRHSAPPISSEVGSRDSEYRIKALFLYRIVRWVTWPTANLKKNSTKITIGIVGKDPFGKELDLLTKLKPINKRKIVIKRFENVGDIKKTQVLFVSRSLSDDEVKEVIAIAQKDHVLLVGEKTGFIDDGGTLGFLIKSNRVKFEVNMIAAKSSKLKISSQILKMAIRILQEKKKKKK
ncbi:MAG: hypothetical protein ACI97A_000507 [Planctomycetota bacterium]|jgi:hypothetical protein